MGGRCECESTLIDTLKRTNWNFYNGSQLTFGPGAVSALAGVIQRQDVKRVLVISDQTLLNAGIVNHVEAVVGQSSAEMKLFAGGEVEPSTELVSRVVAEANEFQPDLFVAVGGGSNMDLAKAALSSFESKVDAEKLFGFDKVPHPDPKSLAPKLVCLPTTSGTGSEVTHSAILTSATTGKKAAILSQRIRPDIAIVDPRLTLSCPPKVTAESGFDALTHAIEAFLVTNFYSFDEDVSSGLPYEGNHPLGDLYAERAISLIGANLQRAFDEPDDLAARSAMAFAATLAGAAFSSCGVSLAHALEYPIGSTYKCSHGIGNAIVLPAVLRFWIAERRFRIATQLGVPDTAQMPEAEAAEAGVQTLESLRKSIGLPTRLSSVGGEPGDIDALATTAMSMQRLVDLSPKTPTIEDAKTMLEASM